MKVTVEIPDELIAEVRKFSSGRTITLENPREKDLKSIETEALADSPNVATSVAKRLDSD